MSDRKKAVPAQGFLRYCYAKLSADHRSRLQSGRICFIDDATGSMPVAMKKSRCEAQRLVPVVGLEHLL